MTPPDLPPTDDVPIVRPATSLPIARRASRPTRRLRPPPARGMLVSLFAYGAVIWSLIGYVVTVAVRADEFHDAPRAEVRDRLLSELLIVGLIDAVIVGIAVALAWRPKPRPAAANPVVAWAAAVPLFALMLAVNIGYGVALRAIFRVKPDLDLEPGLDQGWPAVLAVCVQPAVVEEVLFRFLMLGHLRPFIGMHGAVWLSSFFFTCAHVGQVGAWPVLFLLGAGLGYARVYSGGLTLPIVLHFCHNLIVIWAAPMLA